MFPRRDDPRENRGTQPWDDSSFQSWFANPRIGKGRCGEVQVRLEGAVGVKMSRRRPVRGVGQNMMSLLVQNDLPPTEIFTTPKSCTARDFTCLALLPSSFTQRSHSSTTEKHPSWLFAHNSRTPTSTCGAGQMRIRTVTDEWRRVGVFSTLTNAYAIVAVGASENFYRYARLRACELTAGSRLVSAAQYVS